jgi:hypothetical protein
VFQGKERKKKEVKKMKKTALQTITIGIASTHKTTDGSYIDFYIALNGNEPDADLYRIYSWENEFHKVLGFTFSGHAVRGKARKAATELILEMRKNGCLFGVKEF